jgi:hypothetical protein
MHTSSRSIRLLMFAAIIVSGLVLTPWSALTSGQIPHSGTGAVRTEARWCLRFWVDVVDIFDELSDRAIDILKIDIEGSEHPLLADPRFAKLRVRFLVMEWLVTTG